MKKFNFRIKFDKVHIIILILFIIILSRLIPLENFSPTKNYNPIVEKIDYNAILKKANEDLIHGLYYCAQIKYQDLIIHARVIKNDTLLCKSYFGLSKSYTKIPIWEKSEKYYKKGAQISKKLNTPELEFKRLILKGYLTFIHKLDFHNALKIYEKALDMAKKNGYIKSINSIKNTIALLYRNMGKIYKSIKLFEDLYQKIDKNTGDQFTLALVNFNIAKGYLRTLKIKESYKYYQQALALSNKHNFLGLKKNIFLDLIKYNRITQNYESMASNYQAALNVQHQYYSEKSINALTENGYNFMLNKLKNELWQKELETKNLNSKINYCSKLRLVDSILVVVFLSITIFQLIVYIKKLKNANIQNLEIEKVTNTISKERFGLQNENLKQRHKLIEKNEILRRIKEKLTTNWDEKTKQEVIILLNSNIDNNLNFTKFELEFNNTNSEFKEKLKEKFPILTEHDLNICAMIKSNYSNIEISEITSVSEMAVKKSRYRIRKKLELDTQIHLKDFLENEFLN